MNTGHRCIECSRTLWAGQTCDCGGDDETVAITARGWSVIADEYAKREQRLRELLGRRAYKKTLDRAVAELLEENAMLYRWNAELRENAPKPAPQPAAPIQLDDSWTART